MSNNEDTWVDLSLKDVKNTQSFLAKSNLTAALLDALPDLFYTLGFKVQSKESVWRPSDTRYPNEIILSYRVVGNTLDRIKAAMSDKEHSND